MTYHNLPTTPAALVFQSQRGHMLRENHILATWHRAMRSLGIERDGSPPLRMHDLRHTKGTLMADAGEELTTIQKTLGHARSSITADIYIGNTDTALKRAAGRFGALFDSTEE